MDRHADILDQRDSLRRPLAGSLMVHAGIFGALAIASVVEWGKHEPWGDPNSFGGGAVEVTAVRSLPFPARTGPRNPVASDTQSQIPEPLKPEPKRAAREDPDAIGIKTKKAPPKKMTRDVAKSMQGRVDQREYADNQVFSRAGQAVTSPLFSPSPGAGGVGVGTGAPFGTRFGAYSLLIRDRVARVWRTDDVAPHIKTLPPAIVVFEILRNGQVRFIRVVQSSGNYALDNSAQRAIAKAAPFQPLPASFEGNAATIEFWFQLQR
jgi:TonB family protein